MVKWMAILKLFVTAMGTLSYCWEQTCKLSWESGMACHVLGMWRWEKDRQDSPWSKIKDNMNARGTQEAVFLSSTKEGTGGDRKKPSCNAKPPNQPSAFCLLRSITSPSFLHLFMPEKIGKSTIRQQNKNLRSLMKTWTMPSTTQSMILLTPQMSGPWSLILTVGKRSTMLLQNKIWDTDFEGASITNDFEGASITNDNWLRILWTGQLHPWDCSPC